MPLLQEAIMMSRHGMDGLGFGTLLELNRPSWEEQVDELFNLGMYVVALCHALGASSPHPFQVGRI
jgi:hypothetical protein